MKAGRKTGKALLAAALSLWIGLSLTCTMSVELYYTADPALTDQGGLARLLIYAIRSFSVRSIDLSRP